MDVGLNLYSIRDAIQTEEDFLRTSLRLKEAGYAYLQYSGAPFDAARIARVSRASGLPVTLTHVPFDRIVSDTQKLMDEHALFGCRNIGLSMFAPDVVADETLFRRELERLERAAEIMAERGFALLYHNHQYELSRWQNGKMPLLCLLQEAPHVRFTVDVYWLQYGGADVCDYIGKLRGRATCAHLKDYKIECRKKENGDVEFMPRFAPLGEGNMDLGKVTDALRAAGTRYYFVEQDDAVEYDDPLAEVMRSIEYVKKEL